MEKEIKFENLSDLKRWAMSARPMFPRVEFESADRVRVTYDFLAVIRDAAKMGRPFHCDIEKSVYEILRRHFYNKKNMNPTRYIRRVLDIRKFMGFRVLLPSGYWVWRK